MKNRTIKSTANGETATMECPKYLVYINLERKMLKNVHT